MTRITSQQLRLAQNISLGRVRWKRIIKLWYIYALYKKQTFKLITWRKYESY